MNKKTCQKCGCTDISQGWYTRDQGICFVCNTCGFVGAAEEFKEQSLFDRITTYPERLTETYMFNHDGKVFKSLLLPNPVFNSRLANITGNIPCVCFIASGVYLIKSGYFGTGLFLLIMAACTVIKYQKTSNKESGKKDD